MRAHIPILLCLASVAAPVPAQAFDHHDPGALVARARQAMREDDLSTACVLLWRADQLAPHDTRMNPAWREFEARLKGLPVGEEPAPKVEAVVAPTTKPAPAVPPEPPAPWPAK